MAGDRMLGDRRRDERVDAALARQLDAAIEGRQRTRRVCRSGGPEGHPARLRHRIDHRHDPVRQRRQGRATWTLLEVDEPLAVEARARWRGEHRVQRRSLGDEHQALGGGIRRFQRRP
jgi:hypothetical protein